MWETLLCALLLAAVKKVQVRRVYKASTRKTVEMNVLPNLLNLVRPAGIEPATLSLEG